MGPKVLAGKSWEGRTAGGKSPCGSTFSDHPMDNLTSQLHLLDIETLQVLRPLRSAAHEDKPLSSCSMDIGVGGKNSGSSRFFVG